MRIFSLFLLCVLLTACDDDGPAVVRLCLPGGEFRGELAGPQLVPDGPEEQVWTLTLDVEHEGDIISDGPIRLFDPDCMEIPLEGGESFIMLPGDWEVRALGPVNFEFMLVPSR